MAGFEVTLHGAFEVITEDLTIFVLSV